MNSTQNVHAPFEHVLNSTLESGNFNPKHVVTCTLFLPFDTPISFEWDDLRIWGAQKGKYFRKTPILGKLWESYRKKTPERVDAWIPGSKISTHLRVFLFGRLTNSYIISAPRDRMYVKSFFSRVLTLISPYTCLVFISTLVSGLLNFL